VVTYCQRRNDANLENGNDGHTHNLSANYGVEGPTDDPLVLELRARQLRNFLATLFLSQGVPMLLAGDEMGHSQGGNNNAYCQDNELTWIDWRLLECSPGLVRFVRRLADLRRSRLWLRRDTFLKGAQRKAATHDIAWLHPSGRQMTERDWNDSSLHCLALHMTGAVDTRAGDAGDVLVVFNAGTGPVDLVMPQAADGNEWRMVLDTEQPDGAAKPLVVRCNETLRLSPRSTALLESQRPVAET
jgi:glycogen operon protein